MSCSKDRTPPHLALPGVNSRGTSEHAEEQEQVEARRRSVAGTDDPALDLVAQARDPHSSRRLSVSSKRASAVTHQQACMHV